MKMTNYLSAIPSSLYSSIFYREVGKFWVGRSFVFLLLVLALTWMATALVSAHDIWGLTKSLGKDFSQQLPTIHLKNGVAKTVSKKPTVIYWKSNIQDLKSIKNKPFAVIDTYHRYPNFKKSGALVLVRSQHLYIKDHKHDVRTFTFSKNIRGTIGPKEGYQMVLNIKPYVYSIVGGLTYVIGLSVSYLRYILLGLVYALIGMLFNIGFKRNLNYGHLLSLSLVSFVPTLLYKTICIVFKINFPLIGLTFYVLPLLYLYFGIRSAE